MIAMSRFKDVWTDSADYYTVWQTTNLTERLAIYWLNYKEGFTWKRENAIREAEPISKVCFKFFSTS